MRLVMVLLVYVRSVTMFQESGQPGNNLRPTDFLDTLTRKYYVDKSLLIKEFLQDESNVTLVTAPKGFFKTVNIDMLKRFLEIEVDGKGDERINKTNTRNFKLFLDLKIFKNERKVFNHHFGKHPVVHIDFSPLCKINSYNDMVNRFTDMLVENFRQHSYLKEADNLWITEGSKILALHKYLDKELIKNLSTNSIEQGLEFLCTILHSHFQRRVVVLIDNYDALIFSLIFRGVKYSDGIVKFMQSVIGHLHKKSSKGIVRIFLTGTLHLSEQFILKNTSFIRDYLFLRDHKYAEYYGITGEELEQLLDKHMRNRQADKNTLKSLTSKYYGGYRIIGQKKEIFNPYSVKRYFSSNIPKSYWPLHEHKEIFIRLLYNAEVKEGFIRLLQNDTISVDFSNAFGLDDLLLLKNALDGEPYNTSGSLLQAVFQLTFQLGYLAIKRGTDSSKNIVTVSLPNLENEEYFIFISLDFILQKHDTTISCIDSVNNVINAISVHNSSEGVFMELHEKLSNFFRQSSQTLENESDFENDLFFIFRFKFQHTYTNVGNETVGRIHVLLRNENNVSFITGIKFKGKEDLRSCTRSAVDGMIQKQYVNILKPQFQNRVVYLGLCYSKTDRNFGLGYAKSITEGDDLNKIAYLLLTE